MRSMCNIPNVVVIECLYSIIRCYRANKALALFNISIYVNSIYRYGFIITIVLVAILLLPIGVYPKIRPKWGDVST